MLVAAKVHAALEARADAMRGAVTRSAGFAEQYGRALDEMRSLPAAEVGSRLGGTPWPGARPTAEMDRRGVIIPFAERWETAEEARAWALETLRGVPTVAVDGSQIAPSREFAVPLSLVQVAWFANYHDPDRRYIKDLVNEVVTSQLPDEEDVFPYAESGVNLRRFQLEMEVAAEQVQRLSPQPPPVVFIDGTFVLSFTAWMRPESRERYLQPLFALLSASRERRVPVVGYVDFSLATDLSTMLRNAFDLPDARVPDGLVLRDRMDVFERTAAFQCARGDVLQFYETPDADWRHDLHFVYLKTGQDRMPVRIDFPGWMLEDGVLDHVVDIIRAEIVVGAGYPYALETADATAVLTTEDRLQFYRTYHLFAERAGLPAGVPRKTVSKMHRR